MSARMSTGGRRPSRKILPPPESDDEIDIPDNTSIVEDEDDLPEAVLPVKRQPQAKSSRGKVVKIVLISDSEDGDALGIRAPLDKDDSIFKGADRTPTKVRSLKRDAPITPPLKTRASKGNVREATDNTMEFGDSTPKAGSSPMKKARYTEAAGVGSAKGHQDGSDLSAQPSTPGRLKVKPTPIKASSLSGSLGSPIGLSHVETLSPAAPVSQLAGMTFGQLFGTPTKQGPDATPEQSSQVSVKKETLLEDADLMPSSIRTLPSVCEVTISGYKDPFFEKNNWYADLPNLLKSRFRSFLRNALPGKNPFFSKWSVRCPSLSLMHAVAPLLFVQSGSYINLSRVSPLLLSTRILAPSRYELVVGKDTAICVSCVMIKESFICNDPPQKYVSHFIAGLLQTMEWQRLQATIGMVFDKDSGLLAQMRSSSLQFQTKTASTNKTLVVASDDDTDGFNAYQEDSGGEEPVLKSPSKTKDRGGLYVPALDYEAKIPVFDGRGKDIDYHSDLLSLKQKFKCFEDDEIPLGSFVVVGYTSQVHKSGQDWRYTAFIQWVIVVGTPDV